MEYADDDPNYIYKRVVFNAPWIFTDDTIMAIGIINVLEKFGHIN